MVIESCDNIAAVKLMRSLSILFQVLYLHLVEFLFLQMFSLHILSLFKLDHVKYDLSNPTQII